MNVPITSDIAGYQEFWRIWLTRLVVVGAIIVVELAAILWAAWRR